MCSERSGSNFVTKLMNGHDNVCGPSTKHLINPVARNLFRYGNLANDSNWESLLNDIDRLFNVAFSLWKLEIDKERLKTLAPAGNVGDLLRNIFYAEAKLHNKQHVFIKENHLYEFFPFLQHYFPDARYVYITRDPRDMALSWKKNPDHPGGVVAAARQWRQDQVQSLKNYHILKELGRVCHLRYEDLIAEPDACCRLMCRTLGIAFDPNMRNFYEDSWTQKNASQVGAWKNLAKPVMSENSKKYKSQLTEQEILAIESIAFYEMRQFGYEPEMVSEKSPPLSDSSLNDMAQLEMTSHRRNPSQGVLENMEAKKKFYRRSAIRGM